jgi:hypothetical protein
MSAFAPVGSRSETETPWSVYLADAKEQVARTRAAGMLEFLPYRDAEYARIVALGIRESDRKDRAYAANREAFDAARAVADKRINERYAAYRADLNAPARGRV